LSLHTQGVWIQRGIAQGMGRGPRDSLGGGESGERGGAHQKEDRDCTGKKTLFGLSLSLFSLGLSLGLKESVPGIGTETP